MLVISSELTPEYCVVLNKHEDLETSSCKELVQNLSLQL
jgi:hypothetical protein